MKVLIVVVVFLCMVTPGAPARGQNPSLKELNERSVQLYEQGSYSEAAELAEEALRMAERDLGPHDPQLTTFLNNLAVIYYAQGKYAEAKILYERALGITEKGFGADKTRVTSLMKGVEKCRQELTDKEKAGGKDEAVGEGANKMSQKIFTVQVGAFRSLSRAKALQERLYEKGYGAYITSSVPKKGERLHKVQIGEFSERKKALAASSEIKNSTGLNAFITGN